MSFALFFSGNVRCAVELNGFRLFVYSIPSVLGLVLILVVISLFLEFILESCCGVCSVTGSYVFPLKEFIRKVKVLYKPQRVWPSVHEVCLATWVFIFKSTGDKNTCWFFICVSVALVVACISWDLLRCKQTSPYTRLKQ